MIKEIQVDNKTGITKVLFQGEVQWAVVHQPRDNFGGTGQEFSIDVEATEQDVEKLLGIGLNKGLRQTGKPKALAKTASGKTVLHFIRPTTKKDGTATKPVVVLDKDGNETDSLIGNGSEALVQVTLFPYDNKFGQGMSARLDSVQVLNLVNYQKLEVPIKDLIGTKTGATTLTTKHKKNEDLI